MTPKDKMADELTEWFERQQQEILEWREQCRRVNARFRIISLAVALLSSFVVGLSLGYLSGVLVK